MYSEESDFNSEINLGKQLSKHQFFDGNLYFEKGRAPLMSTFSLWILFTDISAICLEIKMSANKFFVKC